MTNEWSRGLTGDSIIKSLFGKVASLVWGIEDFVVENGEVESKTKTDWVRRWEISASNLGSILVRFQRFVGRSFALVA